MLTMLPVPRASIVRPTSWHRWNGATRLMSIVSTKWSSVSDSAGVGLLWPALLTSTSMVPVTDPATSTNRSRSAATVRSAVTVVTRSPSDPARASSRSARRAATTTWAPAACSTRAKRSPSPDEAPVTMATRPSSANSPDRSTGAPLT